jgi:cytochrome c oxidase subunit 1
LHHQFADPGITTTSKGIQGVLTLFVVIPSLLTAFTLAASLELAARGRGGKGLFGWWKKLPYFESKNWLFPYLFCGLLIFLFGGITGVVNASYTLNNVVHNTAWIPAHFHLTVGGPVFLGILGGSLFLITGLLKKPVVSGTMAVIVPYVWMVGTFIFSSGFFLGGLRGEPRRTNLGLTYMNPASPSYRPDWWLATHMGLVGGCIMGLAVLLYFVVLVRSLLAAPDPALANVPFSLPMSEPYHDEDIPAVRNFTPWVTVAILLCVAAYFVPIRDIMKSGVAAAPGFNPNSPTVINATH